MPWSSVGLLACVVFTLVVMPGLAFQALIFLGHPGGSAVVFAVAVAWIFFIDRRAGKKGNTPLDAGCLVILIGVAVLSGLFTVVRLCNF